MVPYPNGIQPDQLASFESIDYNSEIYKKNQIINLGFSRFTRRY